jgi:nucleoid-associated protein YgaU
MPLEKLKIEVENGPTIEARFNPEKYTVSKSVQIAEIGIPGLDSPIQHYVRGQTQKVSFELFFDTTEFGMVDDVRDVRELTKAIHDLLRIRRATHAPPRCRLLWGDRKLFAYEANHSPWCLLESVSEELTVFSPTGLPLRAKLTVSFREAWTIERQLEETARHSPDRTKLRTLAPRQTLSHLANQEYGNPSLWRPIADANRLDNPRTVTPGTVLEVPRLVGGER